VGKRGGSSSDSESDSQLHCRIEEGQLSLERESSDTPYGCPFTRESDTPYGCPFTRESIVVRLKNDILPSFWARHGYKTIKPVLINCMQFCTNNENSDVPPFFFHLVTCVTLPLVFTTTCPHYYLPSLKRCVRSSAQHLLVSDTPYGCPFTRESSSSSSASKTIFYPHFGQDTGTKQSNWYS
jgi:hypothetical protein